MIDSLFTIVIPTFNRESLLPRALDSIIAQTYPNWECIVVDDHSTDYTLDLLKSYQGRDSRIRCVENEHRKGASGARNTGLDYAKSDWVLFFDSDNYMHHDLLEKINDSLDEEHDVFVWFSNVLDAYSGIKVSTFEPRCSESVLEDIWTERCYVDTNNAVIRKQKLLQIGGWDEYCPSMEEWDLHMRLGATARYWTIPLYLVDYYVGRADSISSDSKVGLDCRLYLLKKHKSGWLNHIEAAIMNYKEILRISKSLGSRVRHFILCLKLILLDFHISVIYYKRKIKTFLHV